MKLGTQTTQFVSTLALSGSPVVPTGYSHEADPEFSAWDKATGIVITQAQIVPVIAITQSQITDGGTLVNVVDLDTISINTTGTLEGSNLSGNNTGDENLTILVPYTGATGSVDLGVHDLLVHKVTASHLNLAGIPTSNVGLAAGDVYRDGATADVVVKIK
jgi:hypothetical protein